MTYVNGVFARVDTHNHRPWDNNDVIYVNKHVTQNTLTHARNNKVRRVNGARRLDNAAAADSRLALALLYYNSWRSRDPTVILKMMRRPECNNRVFGTVVGVVKW